VDAPTKLKFRQAVRVIHAGGVIAYPTEAVFGLGCDPDQESAVARILAMKHRSASAGLILIAASFTQLENWIAPSHEERDWLLSKQPVPVTWVVRAALDAPAWITGCRETIAVRITAHPVAAALCELAGTPLVSTSANRTHHNPARSALAVRSIFRDQVDFVLPGPTGGRTNPSRIHDARTGQVLRGDIA
jgi:L-threonylcarbamoyladenylate synthase